MRRGKKFFTFLLSTVLVTGYFSVALYLVLTAPESQASVVSLFNTYAAWIAGAAATFCGLHSWIDAKVIAQNITEVSNQKTPKTIWYDDQSI
jgi:hypothetical protein